MTTPHEIRVFVGSTRPKNWYGQCAGLTYRTINDCGGYAPDIYGSAFAAYIATAIESSNPRNAPPGAIHYWDYTGTDDRGRVARWGHVAIDIYGGGHQVLSATGYAHEWWGEKAGLITVEAQTARGMPYLGWSRNYGRRNRLLITIPQPAGSGTPAISLPPPTPVVTTKSEEDTMTTLIRITDGPHRGTSYTLEPFRGIKAHANVMGARLALRARNGSWPPAEGQGFEAFRNDERNGELQCTDEHARWMADVLGLQELLPFPAPGELKRL